MATNLFPIAAPLTNPAANPYGVTVTPDAAGGFATSTTDPAGNMTATTPGVATGQAIGSTASSAISSVSSLLGFITSATGWERVGIILLGAAMIIVGMFILSHHEVVVNIDRNVRGSLGAG